MQTNQYEFRGNYAYVNGKRITKKWDLLCEVERLTQENYRLVWGHSQWVTMHYDHLTYGELVVELKQLVKRHEQLTKQ